MTQAALAQKPGQDTYFTRLITPHSGGKGGEGKTYLALNLLVGCYLLAEAISRIYQGNILQATIGTQPPWIQQMDLYHRTAKANGISVTGFDLDTTRGALLEKFTRENLGDLYPIYGIENIVHQEPIVKEAIRVSNVNRENDVRKELHRREGQFKGDLDRLYKAIMYIENESNDSNTRAQLFNEVVIKIAEKYSDPKILIPQCSETEKRSKGTVEKLKGIKVNGIDLGAELGSFLMYAREFSEKVRTGQYDSAWAGFNESVKSLNENIGLSELERIIVSKQALLKPNLDEDIEKVRNISRSGKSADLGIVGGTYSEKSGEEAKFKSDLRNHFGDWFDKVAGFAGIVVIDTPPGGFDLVIGKGTVKQEVYMAAETIKRGGRVLEIIRLDQDYTDTIGKTTKFAKELGEFLETPGYPRDITLDIVVTAVEQGKEEDNERKKRKYFERVKCPSGIRLRHLRDIPKASCSDASIEKRGSVYVHDPAPEDIASANATLNMAAELMGIKDPGSKDVDWVSFLFKQELGQGGNVYSIEKNRTRSFAIKL